MLERTIETTISTFDTETRELSVTPISLVHTDSDGTTATFYDIDSSTDWLVSNGIDSNYNEEDNTLWLSRENTLIGWGEITFAPESDTFWYITFTVW